MRRQRAVRCRPIAALTALAACLLAALVFGFVRERVGTGPEPVQAPPPAVSAAAPPPTPPRVPREIAARLPTGERLLGLPVLGPDGEELPAAGEKGVSGRIFERVPVPAEAGPRLRGPLRVEYTFDAELTRVVFQLLERGRVELGHVILLEPASGRVLAYASTDVEHFPPTGLYPAASLIKVITAAAALDQAPKTASLPCRFTGSPYRLTPARIDPPRQGRTVSLRHALATSNNQCFAQLAVHALGADALLSALERFGWLSEPAPAHPAGTADPGEDRYDVGRLGCGLAGCSITPLHAAQLASILAVGERIPPHWVERVVDADGVELPLPPLPSPRPVLSPELTAELRSMLVETTVRGTARSAFRDRRGRPLLGPVRVAGKTGSLSGRDPKGRYEWFIGAAPAEAPAIAIAVVLVQSNLWWRTASQIAGDVLHHVFCEKGVCSDDAVARWTRRSEAPTDPDSSTQEASPGRDAAPLLSAAYTEPRPLDR